MIISIRQIINFLISVLIPLIVGATSSMISQLLAKMSTSTSYMELVKPDFAPPGYIFPIVWTILYILMGISAYLIIKKGNDLPKVKDSMFYYRLQLLLNFIWSILFFGLDLRFSALITLVILIFIVVVMIMRFYKIDKRVAYLNISYLLWLFYALVLNYFIWMINK